MKKSLLAIAIAAAVPAVASAQITLGGLVDAGVVRADNGAKTKTLLTTSDRSSNHIRMTGEEKIGDLTALFHLEFGYDIDSGAFNSPVTTSATTPAGTGLGFTRRAVVGVKGGWGEIRAGRDYTPIFNATHQMATVHSTSGFASTLGYLNAAAGGTKIVGADIRMSNAIFYNSPVMGGLSVQLANTFGNFGNSGGYEDIANPNYGTGTSATVRYDQGPFGAHVSNLSEKDYAGGKKEAVAFGGKFTQGPFQVSLGNQNTETTSSAGVKVENKVNYFGAAFTMGATRFSVQQGRVKVTGLANGDSTSTSFLVNHSLSKRTAIYGSYGVVDNGAAQNIGVRSNGITVGASALGKDPSAFGFGLVHSF
ncbi:MAG: porin [Betaproteobacteria bacterium]